MMVNFNREWLPISEVSILFPNRAEAQAELDRHIKYVGPWRRDSSLEYAVRTILVGPKRKPEIRWVIKARKVS